MSDSCGQYFILGYYGTHYRVRLYPPSGYRILYKEYNFNHQKNNGPVGLGCLRGRLCALPHDNVLGTLRTPTTWYPTTYLDPDTEAI